MHANIQWLRPDEGGREKPPTGEGPSPYVTIVRFDGDAEDSTSTAWSLVVEKIEAIDPYRWIADVRYLVDDAPQDFLAAGCRFELYEGRKLVATGTVR